MEEKYGEVEEMNVCDNLGDHLVGNVYVKVGAVACPRGHEVGVFRCQFLMPFSDHPVVLGRKGSIGPDVYQRIPLAVIQLAGFKGFWAVAW